MINSNKKISRDVHEYIHNLPLIIIVLAGLLGLAVAAITAFIPVIRSLK